MDIASALNVKFVEALANLANELEQGLISPAQALVGIRVLFDVGSGFIESENFQLVSDFSEYVKSKTDHAGFRFFVKRDTSEFYLAKFSYGDVSVKIFSLVNGKFSLINKVSFEDQIDPFASALKYFLELNPEKLNLNEVFCEC